MGRRRGLLQAWLVGIVLAHLAICLVHGTTHQQSHVLLSGAATAFVFSVILIGPLAGVALTWPAARLGTWVIALTMFGSFVFGVVNHFLIAGADNVAQVGPVLFAATATLLAVTEALGCGLALVILGKGE